MARDKEVITFVKHYLIYLDSSGDLPRRRYVVFPFRIILILFGFFYNLNTYVQVREPILPVQRGPVSQLGLYHQHLQRVAWDLLYQHRVHQKEGTICERTV
jgi:hypothetical protein